MPKHDYYFLSLARVFPWKQNNYNYDKERCTCVTLDEQKRFDAEIRTTAEKTRAEVEQECRFKSESTVKELGDVRNQLEKARDATRDSEVRNAPADVS